MKTRLFLAGIFSSALLSMHAQNVQSNALATSGGLEAGVTGSGAGGNAFYGYRAGKLNNSGTNNSFFGQAAGINNTTGGYNCFFGAQSGVNNTTGSSNVYIGAYSGGENNGSGNTYIGSNSGGDGYGSGNVFIGAFAGFSNTDDNKLIISTSDSKQLICGDFAADQLKLNAKVGIGGVTTFPTATAGINLASYKLFVKGGILADEVRVSTTWADYVFAKGYQLPTLAEVEDHIKTKGHLINVPSAAQIEAEGIEVGQMAKIQQEKIEELTLYLIEQNKISIEQNKINAQQAQEIAALKRMFEDLTAKINKTVLN